MGHLTNQESERPDVAASAGKCRSTDDTRLHNLVRREDWGKAFCSPALHNRGKAEKAVLKMRSEALIEADKAALGLLDKQANRARY